MAAWIIAQVHYHEDCANYDKARDFTRQAHEIAPHLKAVQIMWERYGSDEE